MLEQVYASAALQYPLWDGVVPTLQYNDWLVTPPRLYTESVVNLRGLWSRRERSADAEAIYCLLAQNDQYYFPGWNIIEYQWDASTGVFLQRIDRSVVALTTVAVTSSPYGHLYRKSSLVDAIYQIDPESFEDLTLISRYNDLNWKYGAQESSTVGPFMIDAVADRAVLNTSLNSSTGVSVHRVSTRETLIYNIRTAGLIQDIQAAAPGLCYVVHTNGVVTLLNYLLGAVLGVFRASASATGGTSKLAFDPVYTRVMVCDKTADATDGAATINVEAFRPIPVPVALTPPIPLRAPRAGRQVPLLVRAYGDTGEGVGGVVVSATETGSGTLLAASSPTDEYGYARLNESCDATGTSQINASATV